MAKPKVKAKPKKKAAPKMKVTIEDALEEIKKIHERLDKIEADILTLRGVARPQMAPPVKKKATK
jgi:hypothetical protein